jgi:hypothetical protein
MGDFNWKPKYLQEEDLQEELSDSLFQTSADSFSWRPKYLQEETETSSFEQDTFKATESWELPKQWTEEAMGTIAEGISKVPLLPDFLSWLEPAFEWVQEKIVEPAWAGIITAPWSPSLPWEAGEGWIEHQKREYNAWDAPTYVKGVVEFAMPLWWIPWLGWAGKGAKALGATNKMARALEQVGKTAGKVHLPTDEVLDNTLFKKDFFKTVALWSENKPILSTITRIVAGPSAFVKAPMVGETALDITKRALIKKAVIADMRHGARGILTPRLQKLGDPLKVLDIASDGLVKGVKALDGSSTYLSDLIEGYVKNPSNYKFVTAKGEQFIKDTVGIIKEVRELAIKEGVKVPKDFTFHRMVKGIETEVGGEYELSQWGSKFDFARHRTTMMDGAIGAGGKRKVLYENNPLTVVNGTIDHYIRKVATKRFDDEVGKLGKTALEKYSALFPEEAQKIADMGVKLLSAKHAVSSVSSIITRAGSRLPPATLAKIRHGMPEIAEQLNQSLRFSTNQIDKVISAMGKELWREAKIEPKEFKIILAQFTKNKGKILMGELDDAIHSLNVQNKTSMSAIENAYKEVYKNMDELQKTSLKTVLKQAEDILKTTKTELSPLRKTRSEWIKSYGEGFGLNEKIFKRHPAFRNKIFPTEVVELAEPALTSQGNKWLQTMSSVSGIGRTLVAAMDFSAPFIQGLAVLGRNPVAWAKGVIKQFEFFTKPENFYKYMSASETLALRAERIAFGGSSQTFEYMEAVPQIQKVLGKKITSQTYGRAEVAFTGFGEVARNEMWKALRNKAVKNGVVDEGIARELARTIDRMTGVMSTEALGISAGQRSFENAFVFFAPRYTRASLAYVTDIFKGGISGAEARKSLAALMASGAAMYYGACRITGQQPNFDITSSQFMTLKVGDQHIGIGGSFYGIARMAANVVGKAIDEPLDLVRLSKDDNPFIKFMYQRTSPLVGTLTNIVESENYFGEPFESPADWGRFVGEKVLPIAFQDILSGKAEIPSTVAQVFGGRTFPKSAWELQDEAKERISIAEYNKPYETLPDLYKREINKRPEVSMFQEEIDKRTEQTGDTLSVGFLNRSREIDDARFMYIEQLNQLQKAYDDEFIDGNDFREYLKLAKHGYGMTIEHINSNPEYKDVLEKLNEPQDISKDYVGDIAYQEYISAMYSGQFENIYGLFDYDAYNNFIEGIKKKYGNSIWDYIEERKSLSDQDLPPLAREYEMAKDVLKPYWEVTDQVSKLGIDPDSKKGKELVARVRRNLRLSNPEIAKYYELFYSSD